MVDVVVRQHHTDEEDTVRSYSVDEVIDGTSGFVTATRSGEDWSLEWEGTAAPGAAVTEAEKQTCIAAVSDHLDALAAEPEPEPEPEPASGEEPATEPEPSGDSTEESSG